MMIVDYIQSGKEVPGKLLRGELIVRESVRSRNGAREGLG